jgi:hypothetical protein
MNRLLSLGALALASTALVAQTPLVVSAPSVFANAEGGSSGNIWRAGTNIVQSIYDSTNFSTNGQTLQSPIQINNLEWRLAGGLLGAAVTSPNVEIYLGTSATDYLTPSLTFASNRNPDYTQVYVGPVNVSAALGGTPNDWVINLPLTTPFIYDPSLGADLLVEIVITVAPTPLTGSTMSTGYVAATHLANSVRAVGAPTALSGSISAFAPVVRFSGIEPVGTAHHDQYGTGCYIQARSWYEQFPGSTADLAGNTITMNRNANGGYDVFTLPFVNVTPPTSTGLGLPDDGFSSPIPLGWTFDYPGGSTTDIIAHSNGTVILSGTPDAYYNDGSNPGTLLSGVVAALAPSLQDLLPDDLTNIDNVYAEPDPANPTSVFLITWLNVPCFNTVLTGQTSTFQVALIDNGTDDIVEFRYLSLVNDSASYGGGALTGFSTGGASMNPGSRDLTAVVGTFSTYLNELGPLTLTASPRPVMGTPVNYTVSNIRPAGFSMMVVSLAQDLAGTPLPTYGLNAPGCAFHVGGLGLGTFGPLLFGGPTDGFSFTWPNGYSGVQLFVQAFELATGPVRENPSGIISSNGVKVLLGTF